MVERNLTVFCCFFALTIKSQYLLSIPSMLCSNFDKRGLDDSDYNVLNISDILKNTTY